MPVGFAITPCAPRRRTGCGRVSPSCSMGSATRTIPALRRSRLSSPISQWREVAASTQAQALNALVFLCEAVLQRGQEEFVGVVRAKRTSKLPVVLSRDRTLRLLSKLDGEALTMAQLLYRDGLRILECARLRVQDLDLPSGHQPVAGGQGRPGAGDHAAPRGSGRFARPACTRTGAARCGSRRRTARCALAARFRGEGPGAGRSLKGGAAPGNFYHKDTKAPRAQRGARKRRDEEGGLKGRLKKSPQTCPIPEYRTTRMSQQR